MSKVRNRDKMDLRDENLGETFRWVETISPISNFTPGISETWSIRFRKDIAIIPKEKWEFEETIRSFFIGKMRMKGVVFCWQHRGVVIIVQ